MSPAEIEIPQFLRHLPTYKGMPIPFVQFRRNGVPDFRINDCEQLHLALAERLCGICGRKLHPRRAIAFIGGEKSMESGHFLDPPMHSQCARFAAKVCPYLNGEHRRFNNHKSIEPGAGEIVLQSEVITRDSPPPKRMGIYFAATYDVGLSRDGMVVIIAGPALSIDWTAMPETEEAPR